jgi:hypothetical protein
VAEGAKETPDRVVEKEMTATVGVTATGDYSVEWAINELRLAVLGILISVALAAAAIGLVAGDWVGGLIAGVASAVILIAILKVERLRNQTMRFARWVVL